MKGQKIFIWKETFAIVKAKKLYPYVFASIIDSRVMNEITLIIDQSKLDKIPKKEIVAVEKDWKILSFNMVLPFDIVGFLAKISGELAKKGISIFVISGYSTDHILIKEKNLKNTKEIFKNLGFSIIE